jgi:hypothetical protein
MACSKEVATTSPLNEMNRRLGDSPHELCPAIPVGSGLPQLNAAQAKYLSEKFARLDADTRFQNSMQAIQRLRRDVIKDMSLNFIFCLSAVLIVTKRPSKNQMEELWTYGTGKTWKSLNDFPMRLRRMAEEVKRVQAGLHFEPDRWIYAQSPLAKDIKRRIRELPLNLGVFATHIEVVLKKLPKVSTSKGSPQRKFHEPWASQLSDTVKVLTKRYCDREVAELLNSAAIALEEQFTIEPFALAQARRDRKKKSAAK